MKKTILTLVTALFLLTTYNPATVMAERITVAELVHILCKVNLERYIKDPNVEFGFQGEVRQIGFNLFSYSGEYILKKRVGRRTITTTAIYSCTARLAKNMSVDQPRNWTLMYKTAGLNSGLASGLYR